MKFFLTLLKKDLQIEARSKEIFSLLLGLVLILTIIVSFGTHLAFLKSDAIVKLFPTLLWVVFMFSSTAAIGRSYEYEKKHSALHGVLLSGVPPCTIYLAKFVSNFLILSIGHLISVATLIVLLNIDLSLSWHLILLISILILLAYSALATIIAAITSTSRLSHMLLPLILLPLLFPVLLCALELTSSAISMQSLDWESPWLSLIAGLDVLYFLLGFNLFEFIIKE